VVPEGMSVAPSQPCQIVMSNLLAGLVGRPSAESRAGRTSSQKSMPATAGLFGVTNRAIGSPRQIQMSLRFSSNADAFD
jgi:hypothetical protein